MRNAKKKEWLKRLAVGVGIPAVVCFGVVIFLGMSARRTCDSFNSDPAKRQEMMRIVAKSADLAPIPKQAKARMVRTEGNAFTRSFRISFEADDRTIDDWLRASKGVQSVKPTKTGGIKQYILNVKDGYNYGEVKVDYRRHRVSIYVSWS